MTLTKDKITVFYFARWYPNRYDPMFGLFIQRHAEAVALFGNVGVVYVHAVTDQSNPKKPEIVYKLQNKVHTVEVYYPAAISKTAFLNQFIAITRFYKACYLGKKRLTKEIGNPDLLHIHILTRLGIIGLFYRWFYGIPFIVSEHWSRYLELTGSFNGRLRKFITRLVIKNASFVTTVTQNLAHAMQRHHLTGAPYVVMPNVVDSAFFDKTIVPKQPDGHKTFIHVSCFEDKSKNISGLLRAVKLLAGKRNDFRLVLVGHGMDFLRMKGYAEELGIPGNMLNFTGLLQGKDLVDQMSRADMLLVTSHYENLPVVIIESFVLGIPVLSTRVGGIAEIIDDSNGLLISPGDETELVAKMDQFLDGEIKFDSAVIRKQSRQRYTPEAVGKQLIDLYQQVLTNKIRR
ncbi:MAG: glycosyltransferase [Bacteroidales bacterium]|nr:glycosyltransferase [Bacteroidales bacterium]